MSIPNSFRPVRGGVLPAGYTEVDWLINNDGAYINTGLIVSNLCNFFANTYLQEKSGYYTNGVRTGSNNPLLTFEAYNSFYKGSTVLIFGGGLQLQLHSNQPLGYLVMSRDGEVVRIGTYIKNIGQPQTAVSSTHPFLLFAFNERGAPSISASTILGRITINDPHTGVRGEFVPAIDSSGTGCMFDLVTKRALYPSTGSLTEFTPPK